MIPIISIIAFLILAITGITLFTISAKKIYRNINIGQDIDRTDNTSERIKIMTLVALGQKKMFKRPIAAILHLFIYVSFVITQVELLEIFFDGATGSHRAFRDVLGGFYTFAISIIEVLTVLALIATIAFLSRRNILKVPRLSMDELTGWPKLDANLILLFEFILISFICMMNGADEVLYNLGESHYHGQGSYGFAVSTHLGPMLFGSFSVDTLHIIERVGWWGHIITVFVFMNFLVISKHLHVLLAFPTVFFSNLLPKGQFTNMESVKNEVKAMMDPTFTPPAPANPDEPIKFGAKDVADLNKKQLLDAYTCTECGRCTSSCPQNITGKLLSPRKIMMSTRDRLEEVGRNMDANKGEFKPDEKSLLGDYITPEELWACNSCNACVEECPVNLDPLSIIMDLRRYLVMEDSSMPTELTGMLTNIENNGAPWQFSPADRLNWKNED